MKILLIYPFSLLSETDSFLQRAGEKKRIGLQSSGHEATINNSRRPVGDQKFDLIVEAKYLEREVKWLIHYSASAQATDLFQNFFQSTKTSPFSKGEILGVPSMDLFRSMSKP